MLNLDKNKRYLLACSYGPDSMALFDMLLREKVHFDVAHVNYHLREESNYEEASLRAFCKDRNVSIFVFNNEEIIDNNVEERCREIRYSFFKKLHVQNSYDALLVAHNEDDLIETYLLQKQRKNLVNFYGIQEKSVLFDMLVIRPILDLSKSNILQYCEDNCVPYAIDKTNLLPIYKRNQIRLEVVSNMTLDERKAILAEIEAKNKELKKVLTKIKKVEPKVDSLLALKDIELAYYLNTLVNGEYYRFNLTHKQIEEVRKILSSPAPNISLLLNNAKYKLVKSYDDVSFVENVETDGYSFIVLTPTIVDNEYLYANLLGDTSKRNITLSDYPLTIRTYVSGDEYQIKDYKVKVRRLFIDWKMPASIRKRWPIIINKDGCIIYIPRYNKSFKLENDTNFYVKECFTLK